MKLIANSTSKTLLHRCAAAAILLAALAGPVRAGTINVGDSLIPAGLGVGDSFQLVFLTSGGTTATSSNIADYNTFVNNQAGLSGSLVETKGWTWYAMVSTPTVAARDNAVVVGPVYKLNGTLVANNYGDMWDESLQSAINQTQLNATGVNSYVWTGSHGDGRRKSGGEFALGGNSFGSVPPEAGVGVSSQTGNMWMDNNSLAQSSSYPVYALSEQITVVPEPATLTMLGFGGLAVLVGRRLRRG